MSYKCIRSIINTVCNRYICIPEKKRNNKAGTVLLVGTDSAQLKKGILTLLDEHLIYQQMSQAHNPYGDGKASQRILKTVKEYL